VVVLSLYTCFVIFGRFFDLRDDLEDWILIFTLNPFTGFQTSLVVMSGANIRSKFEIFLWGLPLRSKLHRLLFIVYTHTHTHTSVSVCLYMQWIVIYVTLSVGGGPPQKIFEFGPNICTRHHN
jgi:hypothetical protein